MERGLLWLPLLLAFTWLTWSGWNEYQKIEAYKVWAEKFDRAKYDIYAVLGKKDALLTWGKPTRRGMIDLDSFSLDEVTAIDLVVDNRLVELDNIPTKGRAYLKFSGDRADSLQIPFTEIGLAAKWCQYLRQERETVKNT